ncbi:hypothetical protein YC2023_113383 [Brassica napus]
MAVHVRNPRERHQTHDLKRRRREDEPSSQLPPSPSFSSPAYPHRPSEILRLPRSPQLSLPLCSQRRNSYAAPAPDKQIANRNLSGSASTESSSSSSTSDRMSNHLICLEKHMFFTALLDRVLVWSDEQLLRSYLWSPSCCSDTRHGKDLILQAPSRTTY